MLKFGLFVVCFARIQASDMLFIESVAIQLNNGSIAECNGANLTFSGAQFNGNCYTQPGDPPTFLFISNPEPSPMTSPNLTITLTSPNLTLTDSISGEFAATLTADAANSPHTATIRLNGVASLATTTPSSPPPTNATTIAPLVASDGVAKINWIRVAFDEKPPTVVKSNKAATAIAIIEVRPILMVPTLS
ncbi:unnamed protein product [Caenorhabditis bovis]|uniref:Uncharacterized protein n=1 Tax=Caenorhabditis bovis TaxID=2654633 RepID=A0A8S1EKL0_9PELO|nr:unnamed protein product [Caenorhabditis bovis]